MPCILYGCICNYLIKHYAKHHNELISAFRHSVLIKDMCSQRSNAKHLVIVQVTDPLHEKFHKPPFPHRKQEPPTSPLVFEGGGDVTLQPLNKTIRILLKITASNFVKIEASSILISSGRKRVKTTSSNTKMN